MGSFFVLSESWDIVFFFKPKQTARKMFAEGKMSMSILESGVLYLLLRVALVRTSYTICVLETCSPTEASRHGPTCLRGRHTVPTESSSTVWTVWERGAAITPSHVQLPKLPSCSDFCKLSFEPCVCVCVCFLGGYVYPPFDRVCEWVGVCVSVCVCVCL